MEIFATVKKQVELMKFVFKDATENNKKKADEQSEEKVNHNIIENFK